MKLENTFSVIRNTFLVSTCPYQTVTVDIKLIHRIMAQATFIVCMICQIHDLASLFVEHVNALVILCQPNASGLILRHRMHKVCLIPPRSRPVIAPASGWHIIYPQPQHAVYPHTVISIRKKRKLNVFPLRKLSRYIIFFPFQVQFVTPDADQQPIIIQQQNPVTALSHHTDTRYRQAVFPQYKDFRLFSLFIAVTPLSGNIQPRISFLVYINIQRIFSVAAQLFHKSAQIIDKNPFIFIKQSIFTFCLYPKLAFGTLTNIRYHIIGQRVRVIIQMPEHAESIPVIAVQPVPRTEPHKSVPILINRINRIAGKPVGYFQMLEHIAVCTTSGTCQYNKQCNKNLFFQHNKMKGFVCFRLQKKQKNEKKASAPVFF